MLWHIFANVPLGHAYGVRENITLPHTNDIDNANNSALTNDFYHSISNPHQQTTLSRLPRSISSQLVLSNTTHLDQLFELSSQTSEAAINCLPISESYYRINKRLSEWIKNTPIQSVHSPANALGAVLNHYDDFISEKFFPSFDIYALDSHDLHYIDEAGLLYHHIQQSSDKKINIKLASKYSLEKIKNFKHFAIHLICKAIILILL